MEEKDEVPGFIVLGDAVRLRVDTAPSGPVFRAWAPQLKGVEGVAATAIGAVHALQSELEKMLAANIAPRLSVSP